MKTRKSQRGFWNFVLPAAASLIGGAMANKSNKDIAGDTSEFNAAQAAINRDYNSEEALKARDFSSAQASRAMEFSKDMSNTQWQRGVKDMQAAGLNPMLAFSQGPASSPAGVAGGSSQASGSAAQGVSATMKDVISPAIASAQQFRQVNAQIENTKAQTDVAKAQRDNISQDTINKGTQSDQIVAITEREKATTREIAERTGTYAPAIEKLIQDVKESYAREDNTKVETILKRASIAEARAMEQFYQGIGQSSPVAKLVLSILSTILRR